MSTSYIKTLWTFMTHLQVTKFVKENFLCNCLLHVLLHVVIKLANSMFSLVRWWDLTCTLIDTWLHLLWGPGVISKLLTFHISIIHPYKLRITCVTITVTQFTLFQLLRGSTYSIQTVLCFNAHITCTHSNACGLSDMMEPLVNTLPNMKSPTCNILFM